MPPRASSSLGGARRLARRVRGALAVVLVVAVVAACSWSSLPPGAPGPARDTAPRAGSALALVDALAVRGRGPRTGYTREQFGPAWADTDRNGCDTRNDILARDLVELTFRAGTRDCVVLSGRFREPYTGREVRFSKAAAGEVQIDHVVALSDAWQKGAAQWSPDERRAYANDPLVLLATDGRANQTKGDSDAATWLPPDTGYRCRYLARQVAVKHRYSLAVTAAERDAMVRVLGTCPDEPVPRGGDP
jgi:hypothetical protein